jgi:DNA-binding LacI/PurR family transcriptional regulator
VALPDLGTAYSSELLHALVEAAHARGFSVQIEETANKPQRERELISRAQAHRVDGLILNPIRLEDTTVTSLEGLPPVVVIGEVEQHAVDSVVVDNRAATAAMTQHLLDRGGRRLAVIGGSIDGSGLNSATSRVRLEGVLQALDLAGLELDPELAISPTAWSTDDAAQATEALLAKNIDFDAIMAFTDSMALGILSVLHRHGIRVPEDVLVTGFDDVQLSSFVVPSLTTVQVSIPGLAESALSLLTDRIGGFSAGPRMRTQPFSIIQRDSSS